jgi:hypothetical protein
MDLTENGNTPPPEELMIDYDNVKKLYSKYTVNI